MLEHNKLQESILEEIFLFLGLFLLPFPMFLLPRAIAKWRRIFMNSRGGSRNDIFSAKQLSYPVCENIFAWLSEASLVLLPPLFSHSSPPIKASENEKLHRHKNTLERTFESNSLCTAFISFCFRLLANASLKTNIEKCSKVWKFFGAASSIFNLSPFAARVLD